VSVARIAFQACSFNHSDISPFRINALRSRADRDHGDCDRSSNVSRSLTGLPSRALGRRVHDAHAATRPALSENGQNESSGCRSERIRGPRAAARARRWGEAVEPTLGCRSRASPPGLGPPVDSLPSGGQQHRRDQTSVSSTGSNPETQRSAANYPARRRRLRRQRPLRFTGRGHVASWCACSSTSGTSGRHAGAATSFISLIPVFCGVPASSSCVATHSVVPIARKAFQLPSGSFL